MATLIEELRYFGAIVLLLFLWVCGAVIIGLLALLTRGRRTIIEETIQ